MLALFPASAHALVTYFSVLGDPDAGPAAVRAGRRSAVSHALTTATDGGAGSIAFRDFEVAPEVLALAHEHMIRGQAIMAVNLAFTLVGVGIAVLDPTRRPEYKAARDQGNFHHAMQLVFAVPDVLATLAFHGESAVPFHEGAIASLRERAMERFPDSVAFPDHYSIAGDLSAGTRTAREQRLEAVRRAVTTASGAGGSLPALFEVPRAVMEVAFPFFPLFPMGIHTIVVVDPVSL